MALNLRLFPWPAVGLLLACSTFAQAQTAQTAERLARGERLYSAHCQRCHTTQMHWRNSRLVADWDTLRQQVRRWQSTAGLAWSDEDITSVALYLNQQHYGYPQDATDAPLPEAERQPGPAH